MNFFSGKLNKIVLIVVFLLSFLYFSQALAQEEGINQIKIYFSGILKNNEGEIANEGNYSMQFSIYESATSSELLWQEKFFGEEAILIQKGKFQIILGSNNVFNVDFNDKKYWLGISVGDYDTDPVWGKEMVPRIPIVTLESLFLEEKIEVSQEDFIKILIEEFKKSATSTESINQRAFLEFLQQRLNNSEAQAVIISPQTLNVLFNGILNFEAETEDGVPSNFWATLLQFFEDILETISNS